MGLKLSLSDSSVLDLASDSGLNPGGPFAGNLFSFPDTCVTGMTGMTGSTGSTGKNGMGGSVGITTTEIFLLVNVVVRVVVARTKSSGVFNAAGAGSDSVSNSSGRWPMILGLDCPAFSIGAPRGSPQDSG